MLQLLRGTALAVACIALTLSSTSVASATVTVYEEVKPWGVFAQARSSSDSDPRFQAWAQRGTQWKTGPCRNPFFEPKAVSEAYLAVSGTGGSYGKQTC